MTKNIVWGLLVSTLCGCAGYADYPEAAKTPAPKDVSGVWMTSGPQKPLADPAAIATLIVSRSGDTLDCRQWQRTIERRGKLTWRGETLYNVNIKNEYNKITVTDGVMKYNRLTLLRVEKPTVECQAFAAYENGDYIFADRLAPEPQATKSHKKASGVERREKTK
ncbi:hypothetical protein [Acerihabitans arboris]|uniref:Lipoprotein n=1 Tax=Acerihabitans arboris TaxID=2691583 RepID=A0A845SD23_9GAMM|nr:hypothetical protein [Acerihabitans arboris]NDL62680.1 hypothetical protein [Acerihabitans arboris]